MKIEFSEKKSFFSLSRSFCLSLSAILCREELQSKVMEFSEKLLSDETLAGGASAMMKAFDLLKSNPSELLLALHSFGRHDTALQQAHSAIVRGGRKVRLEVRRRLAAGRPTENVASCNDHHYSHPVGGAKCASSVGARHSEPQS